MIELWDEPFLNWCQQSTSRRAEIATPPDPIAELEKNGWSRPEPSVVAITAPPPNFTMADDSTFVIMFGVLKRSPGSSACEWVDVQFAYIPRSSPRLSHLSRQAEVLVSFAGNLKFSYYKVCWD